MKKKKKNVLWIVLLFILLIGTVAISALLLKKTKDEADSYKVLAEQVEATLEANTKLVWVATEDLAKGTVLEQDVNVVLQENITGLPEVLYISEEDMGKTLTVDITAYEPIMASMVTAEQITKDAREVEIGVATLMLNQEVNDYVDLRIQFPNGADYIIASKLKVKSLNMDNSIFYTNLNESEILTLASATIDAYTVTGTKIYLAKYVESNLQEEALPNYPVSDTTLALMATDPNILEVARDTLNANARAELQGRLQLLSEDWLKAVSDGHGLVDTAHNTALSAQQAQQAMEEQSVEYEETDAEVME